jgi:hypothetical protein
MGEGGNNNISRRKGGKGMPEGYIRKAGMKNSL